MKSTRSTLSQRCCVNNDHPTLDEIVSENEHLKDLCRLNQNLSICDPSYRQKCQYPQPLRSALHTAASTFHVNCHSGNCLSSVTKQSPRMDGTKFTLCSERFYKLFQQSCVIPLILTVLKFRINSQATKKKPSISVSHSMSLALPGKEAFSWGKESVLSGQSSKTLLLLLWFQYVVYLTVW